MVTDLAFASVPLAVSLPPPAVFDTCLQDDSSGSVLQFNSSTGDYVFCCANGVTVSGRGTVSRQGNIYSLQQGSAETDRRLTVRVDQGVGRGTATLQSPPGRIVCTITDRNTKIRVFVAAEREVCGFLTEVLQARQICSSADPALWANSVAARSSAACRDEIFTGLLM